MVPIGRASGMSAVLARRDEAGGPERTQMLSHGAGRDVECGGEFVSGCIATSLQGDENSALRGRRHDFGAGHGPIIAGTHPHS